MRQMGATSDRRPATQTLPAVSRRAASALLDIGLCLGKNSVAAIQFRKIGKLLSRPFRRDVMPKLVVVGSLNMDLVVRAPHLPRPGETILGRDFMTAPGGKGANQTVAAAKLGAAIHMVGRVGGDDFGRALRENLCGAG